jgi:glycosyltransferase involved in cell wall biosynthesis
LVSDWGKRAHRQRTKGREGSPAVGTQKRGRVLILVQNLSVPFDRRVWLECQSLVAAGYRVAVVCPKAPGDPTYYRLRGVDLFKYRPYAPGTSSVSFVLEYVYSFIMTLALSLRANFRDPFDVVQSCNPPDLFWPIGLLFRLLNGSSFVFDHHDLCPELFESRFPDGNRFVYRALRLMERCMARTADHVISTNDSYRRIVLERDGVSPTSVTVVRTGPDLASLRHSTTQPSVTRTKPHVAAYIGVMGPQDGVELVLEVADQVVHRLGRHDIGFTLIGSGDCYDELVALSHRLELTDYVTFTGRIPDADVAAILSTADVGISPDPKNPLNDASTMNKTVEYMAFGLPVVAFELHETRVSAGSAALYATPGNVAEFATTMADLLDDEDRRALMSREASFRIETQLAWHHQRDKYIGVYRALLPEALGVAEITLPDALPTAHSAPTTDALADTETSDAQSADSASDVIDLRDSPYPQEIDLSQVH